MLLDLMFGVFMVDFQTKISLDEFPLLQKIKAYQSVQKSVITKTTERNRNTNFLIA